MVLSALELLILLRYLQAGSGFSCHLHARARYFPSPADRQTVLG